MLKGQSLILVIVVMIVKELIVEESSDLFMEKFAL